MLDFLNKPYPFNNEPKYYLKVITAVSLGMFLFMLFFQPLDLAFSDFNSKLYFITGFGGIILLILVINRVLLPAVFPRLFIPANWNLKREILLNLLSWVLLSVAITFYTYYVGHVELSIPVLFRILLLSLASVIILIVVNQHRALRKYLKNAIDLNKRINKDGAGNHETEIELISENRSEMLKISLNQLLFIRSANNYIEVVWKKEDRVKKMLLRKTLKNIETEFSQYKNIVRCHRSCLVNINHVQKLAGNIHDLSLKLKYFDEELPVSRQYALKLRETLKNLTD